MTTIYIYELYKTYFVCWLCTSNNNNKGSPKKIEQQGVVKTGRGLVIYRHVSCYTCQDTSEGNM